MENYLLDGRCSILNNIEMCIRDRCRAGRCLRADLWKEISGMAIQLKVDADVLKTAASEIKTQVSDLRKQWQRLTSLIQKRCV